MTSAWSQLEQMLTCAICLDKFKNPRLLPCQHSFCGDACMDGLVDYARRQIKCPECRAEHRIPYQGVASLPVNVTLIRFLELHSRITGEEPEPVPTFMEKCSVCGEKVDGVQKCSHCDKKVCPECKEAHIDLLKREINRLNGQSKRCLSKIEEFKETLERADERLKINHATVKHAIEESCRRLIDDLKAKQRSLIEDVDTFAEQERKTVDKLKIAIVDELQTLESNSKLADDKINGNKYQWTDQELSEMKEIYAKAMEFVRLFDPDIGDFTRKMRFTLIPEFESLRRKICEVGEVKFGESADCLMANSFQHCNATGNVAIELCNSAAAQAAAQAANANGAFGYSLSHSNSNTNLGSNFGGAASSQSTMLELPSMQNALMRSQSDHRLASQFQQRLKLQQQQQQQQQEAAKNGALGLRYGTASSTAYRDHDTDSIRSRYAPPRTSARDTKDYTNDLTRDWPRPSDSDTGDISFGSSIHFKSAFMRRKEKERQQYGTSSYNDDDDDLTSEASYGGHNSIRNVRFYDQNTSVEAKQQAPKLFDVRESEHAPLSGVPKLEDCPHLLCRLHQMGAKAIVDKKNAEEEGKRDKDLVESARQAMSRASERSKTQRQLSEDEIERQKRTNKQREEEESHPEQQQQPDTRDRNSSSSATLANDQLASSINGSSRFRSRESQELGRHSPTPTADLNSSSSTVVEAEPTTRPSTATVAPSSVQPITPASPSTTTGGRRGLYGQAVTEKSKRQLSNAIQDAAAYTRRRNAAGASSSIDGDQTPDTASSSSATTMTTTKPKRTLRSSGRSLSKQSSIDAAEGSTGSSTGTVQRRRKNLTRADSSQQSVDSTSTPSIYTQRQQQQQETQSKNFVTGSGGHSDNSQSSNQESSLAAGQDSNLKDGSKGKNNNNNNSYSKAVDQTSTTTDEDDAAAAAGKEEEDSRRQFKQDTKHRLTSSRSYGSRARQSENDDDGDDDDDDGDDNDEAGIEDATSTSAAAVPVGKTRVRNSDNSDDNNDDDDDDDGDGDKDHLNTFSSRNTANRASRELLPNAVNKLLDRSAQIRRDSQEQRSRGDSPQRTIPTTSSRPSYYSSSSRTNTTPGYSSSPGSSSGMSSATRQRLAYQRSQSIRDSQHLDDDTTNSSNSIYTTASSSGSHLGSGRRSSAEDELNSTSSTTTRRMSSNSSSTDRTFTGTTDLTRPSYTRRDSSGETSSSLPYQSRFLSRSRTSAALSNIGSSTSSSRDQEKTDTNSLDRTGIEDSTASTSDRSYLSSRDRFMQSAGVVSASGASLSSSPSAAGSSNLYSRNTSSAGKFTNLLAWRSMLRARFNFPNH